jgi:hypothetical protein
MVLGELTQSELDRLDKGKIQSAIEKAKQSTKRDNGDAASSVIASETVQRALRSLKAEV